MSKKASQFFFVAGFLLPALLLYSVFVLGPLIQTFQLSTFRMSGMSLRATPVGIENYQLLAENQAVWTSFRNVFLLLFVGGFLILGLSLLLAHATAGQTRRSKILRSVYLLPNVISVVAVAALWRFVYHPTAGVLNGLGFTGPQEGWLGSTKTAFWMVLVVFVWVSVGFYTMLFAAGLNSIGQEVTEAAELEGVSGWKKFWSISWPMMHAIRRVAVVYLVINVMATFALVNVMTDGTPADQTQVVLNYLYRLMLESQYGQAAALGAINVLVILAVTMVVFFIFRKNPEVSKAR